MKRAHTIYKNHSILVGNTVQIYKKQSQLRTTATDKYLYSAFQKSELAGRTMAGPVILKMK